MLLNVDKIITLKSVDIFSQIPDDVLGDLAALLEEEVYPADTEIIRKGDVGNFMYIIKKGKVKIHDGNTVFAEAADNDIVGELSVLNPMPRTATVTTLSEALLLKLEREPFVELLSQEIDLVKSILKVLTNIISRQNQKISELESAKN
ncbi:MAG: cyclic nucleotide-binding domain-containing protein [Bacteroidia bacterium]